jgi:hypothetical protein
VLVVVVVVVWVPFGLFWVCDIVELGDVELWS